MDTAKPINVVAKSSLIALISAVSSAAAAVAAAEDAEEDMKERRIVDCEAGLQCRYLIYPRQTPFRFGCAGENHASEYQSMIGLEIMGGFKII